MPINFKKLDLIKNLYKLQDIDIYEVVDNYFDPQLIRKVLSRQYSWKKYDYKKLDQVLQGTKHHRDFRDNRGYAYNLIINWLVEDLIYEIIKKKHKVFKVGADAKRKLLIGEKVSSEPDLLTKGKKKLWIEIISNYPITGFSSFWEKEFFFDLRDNKFNSLLKKSKSDNVIVIGIVVVKGLFFLKQISDSTSIKPQQDVKNFGKKKSTRIFFSNKNLELNELNKLNIILELKQLI